MITNLSLNKLLLKRNNTLESETLFQLMYLTATRWVCEKKGIEITLEGGASYGSYYDYCFERNGIRVIVEFKLMGNAGYVRGYNSQILQYIKESTNTNKGIYVLFINKEDENHLNKLGEFYEKIDESSNLLVKEIFVTKYISPSKMK